MVCKKDKIKLKILDHKDVNLIQKLQKISEENTWTKASLIHLFKEGSGSGFILFKGREAAGYIIVRILQDELEVLSFGVSPRYRRMGLGSMLFKEIEKCIIINKKNRLFLEVNNNNNQAKDFYSSMGLKKIKILKKYYKTDGGQEDGLMLSKFYI
jgi:ribosomal-protein-alanine N-acetyltransferase|tara:strand:- start:411 stop:875 length:465 start_codon:yes stop_codon:yes gene_type:complete